MAIGTASWCCPRLVRFWRPDCASWRPPCIFRKLVRSPGYAPGFPRWQRDVMLLDHDRIEDRPEGYGLAILEPEARGCPSHGAHPDSYRLAGLSTPAHDRGRKNKHHCPSRCADAPAWTPAGDFSADLSVFTGTPPGKPLDLDCGRGIHQWKTGRAVDTAGWLRDTSDVTRTWPSRQCAVSTDKSRPVTVAAVAGHFLSPQIG